MLQRCLSGGAQQRYDNTVCFQATLHTHANTCASRKRAGTLGNRRKGAGYANVHAPSLHTHTHTYPVVSQAAASEASSRSGTQTATRMHMRMGVQAGRRR